MIIGTPCIYEQIEQVQSHTWEGEGLVKKNVFLFIFPNLID